eukprot:6632635-Pyramimonas_sp.AAC.1
MGADHRVGGEGLGHVHRLRGEGQGGRVQLVHHPLVRGHRLVVYHPHLPACEVPTRHEQIDDPRALAGDASGIELRRRLDHSPNSLRSVGLAQRGREHLPVSADIEGPVRGPQHGAYPEKNVQVDVVDFAARVEVHRRQQQPLLRPEVREPEALPGGS